MSMLHQILALLPKGADPPVLTQKGYGHVYGASDTADLTLSYANVDGGSAPAAGDLVVWLAFAVDSGGSPVADLTGSGWTQSTDWDGGIGIGGVLLTKVVVAGDVSAPPTIVSAPTSGSVGFWAAYSFTGVVSSLTIPDFNFQYAGAAAPSNEACDSSALSAPAVAITIAGGGGSDGSPSMSISGAAANITFNTAANVWFAGTVEDTFLVNMTIGGASITFSKGDDGNTNHLAAGYIAVS